jgi:D-amino peptidase
MKVYVSVDMEGCSGVVHREHTNPKGYDYHLGRHLMTQEANAAIQGAFDGGATSVVVSDAHGGNGMRSLLVEELDERAQAVIGTPRRLGQLEGIDSSFDALLQVGYHTRHGRSGVLSHTTNGRAVANLWIQDRVVGEVGLNDLLAGHFGVPTALVTGDDLTVAEARESCPSCETVTVKWAMGRYAARCLHPAAARKAIREGAAAALQRLDQIPATQVGTPVRIRLQFKESGSAESAARLPGVELVDDDTVEFTCPTAEEAYAAYTAAVELWYPAWGEWISS